HRQSICKLPGRDQNRDGESFSTEFPIGCQRNHHSDEYQSFVIIGIILLVLCNTMIMSVRERTHEYAVLKALGFTGHSLFFLIAGESMILAAFGSSFGLFVILPAVEVFQKSLPKGWFPVFYVKPDSIRVYSGLAGGLQRFDHSDSANSHPPDHRRLETPG